MRRVWFSSLFVLLVISLWICGTALALEPFTDNFDRGDSADVGNGWEELEDEGISISIAGGEALIQGTQDVDWERNGIQRAVDDISSLYFDYVADDNFNMHCRIDDTASGAYLEIYSPPGSFFRYANSPDGVWPGWISIEDAQTSADRNTIGIERVGPGSYQVKLNGAPVDPVLENAGLMTIDRILISVDSAAGAVGSMHIDNVVVDGGATAVRHPDKLTASWGQIKSSL